MRKFKFLLALLLVASATWAQTRQLTGNVKDSKTGSSLPSVTVKVRGQSVVTSTDANGSFSIKVPSGAVTLDISTVGYVRTSVSVGAGETNVLISLTTSVSELNEVVVTALGISKEAKKIGYAVTTVNSDQFDKARESNVALGLEGQVAGLNVHGTSTGPGGTARILLRGMPSITGNGAPLFVLNGIPIDNTQRGSASEWGGADNGDGIGNLNPDDIESMTVLKGQAASALYGARAANGVILITTKTGKKGSFSVDYNGNFLFERAINNTDYQYVYGQGQQGIKPGNVADAQAAGRLSWGSKLDGSSTIQYDGNKYAYSAYKDNIKNFYRTGPSLTNTVSVSSGSDRGAFRLSVSNLDTKGIIRNSGLTRRTVNLNLDQKITDKLKVTLMANYIDQEDKNKPQVSDGPMNANNGLFLANNINEKILAPGYNTTTGQEVQFSDDNYVTNPWFVVNQYINNLGRKRLITAVSAKYNFTDWLYVQGRVGYDYENDRVFHVDPWGTGYSTNFHGNLDEQSQATRYELNVDGLVGVTHEIVKNISGTLAVGANTRKNEYEYVSVGGGPFVLPYLYSWNNVVSFNRNYSYSKQEVNSAYYTADFSYKNFLTLSTTGRFDAYSTLPTNHNSVFAPSVSGSFIFSELAHIPALSYGKLRAAYAITSNQGPGPYNTSVYYGVGNSNNGTPTGNFSFSLPNGLLKPFTLAETEVGTELKFFHNRLGVDVSYFYRKTKNEILGASYSASTGYTSGFVPSASTQNKGIEILLTGTPIQTSTFTWNVGLNMTSVHNRVLETDPGGNPIYQGTDRPSHGNAITQFVKGLPGPQIQVHDYKYDTKGNIVVDASGLPEAGSNVLKGSVLPTFYGGLNNNLTYKNINLSFLLDFNYGNKVLSSTAYYSVYRGLNKMTLQGRDNGFTVGVHDDGTTNTVNATAQNYWQAVANNVQTIQVLNGDYIKLRQITLGYTLNERLLGKLPLFRSISISLVGRNLWTLLKHTDNIDPENSFGSSVQYAGIEGTSLPATRSFGFNANFKFK